MSASGYGDLVGKVTAGADWIIADAVKAEPIDPIAWDMVQTELRDWIREPAGLKGGNPEAFAGLFRGLTMSGLAMQALRKSRPASGTEHLFSHYWEMRHLQVDGSPVSHGFKVAVGTLAATAFMEVLLDRPTPDPDAAERCSSWPGRREREAEVRRAYGDTAMTDQVVHASLAKLLTPKRLAERLGTIRAAWPEILRRVKRQLLPYRRVRDLLERAGCPTTPGEIGLTRPEVETAFPRAQMFRNRYTALDLAYELGWLEDCIRAVFASPAYLT
jgi:glycerol-1-phosphate dehydrogenase [NAD(P)+]